MRVLLLLLLLALAAAGEEPADVESTIHPLTVPAPVALEKLDLNFDFRSTTRPGMADVHLDALIANHHPVAEDMQLMLVTFDSNLRLSWQGAPQDSQRLAVPFPTQTSRVVPVALTRLIFMTQEEGHLSADFRLKGLARGENSWEFLFRLPDRNYWQNLGPTVILVRSTPWLEVTRLGAPALQAQPAEAQGPLLRLEVSPFHPRGLHLRVRWLGPRPELTVALATTLSAWLGLLVSLPLTRRLGRLGSFLAAGLATLVAGQGAHWVIEHEKLLIWTTPPGGWEESLPPLLLTACAVAGFMAAWWAGGPRSTKRNNFQTDEKRAHA